MPVVCTDDVMCTNSRFYSLEAVITYLTGAVAREDDMLWTGITAKQD